VDLFSSDAVQDLLACLPGRGSDDPPDPACLADAVEELVGSFNVTLPDPDSDDFFSAFTALKDTVDGVCGCRSYLEAISDACLEQLGEDYGIPLDDVVNYVVLFCDNYDDFQSCDVLTAFESECESEYAASNLTQLCSDYVIPLETPGDLAALIDVDADDLGCAVQANIIIRLPDDFVQDCEVEDPSLEVENFRHTCQNWTVSASAADDGEAEDDSEGSRDDEDDGRDDGDDKSGGRGSSGGTGDSSILVALVAVPFFLVATCCILACKRRQKDWMRLARGEFVGMSDADDEVPSMEMSDMIRRPDARTLFQTTATMGVAQEEEDDEETIVVSAVALPAAMAAVHNPLAGSGRSGGGDSMISSSISSLPIAVSAELVGTEKV